jgi:hypothetical protein
VPITSPPLAQPRLVLSLLASLLLRLLAVACLLPLSACTYSVIPLVPSKTALPTALLFEPTSALVRERDRLVLHLHLRSVPDEGYLAVYLYQNDLRVAEDSRYLTPTANGYSDGYSDNNGSLLMLNLAKAQLGRYRAVVFWQNRIVRQFEIEVKAE